jgi:excisionase family DNA binding protein
MDTPGQPKTPLTARLEELLADGADTPKSAAAFLKVSVAQVYKWMGDGTLPFAKLGRSRRIPRRALLELMAKNLIGGSDP